MKALWRSLLFLMLSLPALLVLALFTESGSRAILQAAGGLAPVEIEYGSGTFSGRLHLKRLGFQADGLHLVLEDLVAELDPGCLWSSALCFRQLRAAHLDIALLSSEADSQPGAGGVENNTSTPLIVFPVPLSCEVLEIESTRIHWQDGEWRQGVIRAQLRISSSTVALSNVLIQQPHLVLRESQEKREPAADVITLPRIVLPIDLQVSGLRLDRPSWDFYGSRRQHEQIDIAGRWANSTLELEQLEINDADVGRLALRGGLDFSGDWPLQVSFDIAPAQTAPWDRDQQRRFTVTAQGTLAAMDLALAAPGEPAFAANAQVNILDRQLPFSATLRATSSDNLQLTDLEGVPDSLADLQLAFPLSIAASGTLSAQQFTFEGAASGLGYQSLLLVASARHEEGVIAIDQLSVRDPAGLNNLRGSGELSLESPQRWSLNFESGGLDLPDLSDQVFGRLAGELQLHGQVLEQDWNLQVAEVNLQGQVNDLPASINGFAGLNSALQLSHSQLEAQVNGALLELQSPPVDNGQARLDIAVEQLARWQPGSQGALRLRADFARDWRQARFSGTAEGVRWQGLSVATGTIDGEYRAAGDHTFNFDSGFEKLSIAGVDFDSLHLSATGNASQHAFTIRSQGDVGTELLLTGATQGGQWTGFLAPTRLDTPHGIWQLSQPVQMTWSDPGQQLQVDEHCWTQDGGRLCPGELRLGRKGNGNLQIDGDMALLAGLLPPDAQLQGAVQLHLEADWGAEQGLIARGRSTTQSVRLSRHYSEGESASISWDRGDGLFDYGRDGLTLDWKMQRGGRQVLGLALQLPPDREDALTGVLNVEQMQLSAFQPFVPSLSRLEGDVGGQLQLAGTVDRPLAYGRVNLSQGRLGVIGNPTEVKELELALDAQGDRAVLNGSGMLGGGLLELAGEVALRPELRIELSLQGGKHHIAYPPSLTATLTQKLTVVASKGLLDIAGELKVHEGVLEFEQLPEGSVALSADVVEVDYAGNVVSEELPFDIRMDVSVAIQDEFKVAGSVLQTQLGGNLRLRQQPGQPLRVFGDLSTVGGEMRAYGQHLKLKRGRVSFSGPPGNPLLNVRAQRQITSSNVTVGVQVEGRLEEDLLLKVYSEPAMSDSEAMSYLVRGRGLDSGAGADGTALALSMASGVVNRSTLLSELNRIPGISQIEFGAEGREDDTAATLSGYIGGRIYLSYGFGLYEPVNVLTSRLYLRPRLWLEVVSSLENSVDLYYSFDID